MKLSNFLKLFTVVVVSVALLSACSGGKAPEKDPLEAVKTSLVNLDNVKSSKYLFSFTGNAINENIVKDGEPSKADFRLSLSGALDVNDKKNPLFSMILDVAVKVENELDEFAEIEIRGLEDFLYVQLSKMSDLGGMVPEEMVSPFVGTWWKLPVDKSNMPDEEETPDNRFEEIFGDSAFFTEVAYVGTEKVAGTNTYKYSFDLNSDAVLAYIIESNATSGMPITNEQIEEYSDVIDNMVFEGLLWVGQSDEILRKMSIKLSIENYEGVSFDGELIFELLNVNAKVSIPEPKDAVEFNPELMGGLL